MANRFPLAKRYLTKAAVLMTLCAVVSGSEVSDSSAIADSLLQLQAPDTSNSGATAGSLLDHDTQEVHSQAPDSAQSEIIMGETESDSTVEMHVANTDSITTDKILIEGIVVSAQNGEFPGAENLTIKVDSLQVSADETGMFRTEINLCDFFTVQVTSSQFEIFREVVKVVPDQNNYFISVTLKERKASSTQIDNIDTPPDTAHAVPWTISGTIIDSRVDLAIKSDSTVLKFDGQVVPNTSKGNFYITTRIGGRHVLQFTCPGYNEVLQEILLDGGDKQPFIVMATSPEGEQITKREIVVSAKAEPLHRSAEISKVTVSRKEIQRTATTLSDPMRVLLTLPGVTSSSDLSSRPIVRGGEEMQTRTYLDGVSLIQPFHFGGLHSTFNPLSVQEMTLYPSGFPSHLGNSLSALVEVKRRRPAEEPLEIAFDANILQSAAYVGVPLLNGKAGVNGSWQGSYYQHMFNLGLLMFNIEDAQDFMESVSLPNYNDYSLGFQLHPNSNWSFQVNGDFYRDDFVLSSSDSGYIVDSYYHDGDRVWKVRDTISYYDEYYYYDDNSYIDSVKYIKSGYFKDTLMMYKSHYNMISGSATFTPDENWVFTGALAWQKRWWDLNFPEEYSFYIDSSVYDISINQGNSSLGVVYSGMENHILKAGIQVDYTSAKYKVYLARFLHEIITRGSLSLYDFWGPVNCDTAVTLLTDDPEYYQYDILNRLLVKFNGDKGYLSTGMYISDNWTINDKLTADAGVRVEASSADNSVAVSPRLTLKYSFKENTELMFSTGHYTQNNYEPAAIALSKDLGPESVWHFDMGSEMRIFPWLTYKSNVYYKLYNGLLSEVITDSEEDTTLSRDVLITMLMDYDVYYGEYKPLDYYSSLTTTELLNLAKSQNLLSTLSSSYTNKGKGIAYGWENSLRIQFSDYWHGWISASLGRSKRQRMPGWRWHDFPLETPVLFSVVSYYRLPRRYELSVKYRFTSGLPYTPVKTDDNSLTIANFNSARFTPYHSLDFRIAKGFVTKWFKGHTYLEVSNSLNAPNSFLLDNEKKTLQGTTFNIPAPIILLGLEFDLL